MKRSPEPDGRIVLPAATRNREPILQVLRRVLPATGTVLELASGTGQHAWYLAKGLPHLTWQPSERDEGMFASIRAWQRHDPVPNLLAPIPLDVTAADWPLERAEAVFCSNLFHVAPWEVTVGVMHGAGRVLPPGAPLVTYGAYRIGGEHAVPSNRSFDADLRARNPAWGVRDLEAVAEQAEVAGLGLVEQVVMPNNNHCLVFRRSEAPVPQFGPPSGP